MTTTGEKTTPIPTRFEADEKSFLESLSKQTGLPKSELIRRSVRLLKRETSADHSGLVLLFDLVA